MLFNINGVCRLTREPELRHLPSGSGILKIGLATSKKRKDASGNTVEKSCFIDAKLFGKRAELMASWLKKGSQVYIVGELDFEQWTAQDGSNRNRHTILISDIEILDKKGDSSTNHQNYDSGSSHQNLHQPSSDPDQNYQNKEKPSMDANVPEYDINEDEIPF